MLFSEVARRRFDLSRTWNIQTHCGTREIASISVSLSKLLVLPVCTWWCSPESYGVDAVWSVLGVPENIAASAEIMLVSFSAAKLHLLPVSVLHLELLCERSVGWGWHIYQWKTCRPQKLLGIAIEIASISVSFAKLLVLPVWGTVSTSGLCLMVFSIVGRCRGRWKWIGNCV